MKPTTVALAVDAGKVATGRMDPRDFAITVLVTVLAQPTIYTELRNMDFSIFFVPEGLLVPTVLIMAIFGIFAAIAWAGRLKYLNAPKGEGWKFKYVFSMILTMVIAPILANGALGWMILNGIKFSDFGYCVVLILAIIAISALTLLTINYGFKYTLSVFKPAVADAKEAAEEVVTIVKKP